MAIIIPSRNIYNINNSKIKDNVIDNVSVKQTIIQPNNEYERSIYNQNIELFSRSTKRDFKLIGNMSVSNINNYSQEAVGVGIKYDYIRDYTITIPKRKENRAISDILLGVDKEEKPRIKSTIYYVQKEGIMPITFKHKFAPNITGNTVIKFPVEATDVTISYSDPQYTQISDNMTMERIASEDLAASQDSVGIEGLHPIYASVSINDFTNLGDKNIITQDDDNYYLKVSVICGYEKYNFYHQTTGQPLLSALNTEYNVSASVTRIEPIQLELTIYGNTIGIDLTDGSITYGGGDNPYSTEGNELIQESGTYNSVSLTEDIANNILREYKNGKETAELLCNVGDYYALTKDNTWVNFEGKVHQDPRFEFTDDAIIFTDPDAVEITAVEFVDGYPDEHTDLLSSYNYTITNKNQIRITSDAFGADLYYVYMSYFADYEKQSLVIGSKANRMTFNQGDIIQPMKLTSRGFDEPMSKLKDGSPKQFRVVSVGFIYDGSILQRLNIQEI